VLAIHLSVHVAEQVQQELTSHYGADCPAAIVWRASWPDEQLLRTRVGDIASAARSNPLQRSALILVGATLSQQDFGNSRLYADDYDRRYRPRGDEPRFPRGTEDA
jgi:precorrin-4/cobalt-precorrin-4 C11-methyltransferase